METLTGLVRRLLHLRCDLPHRTVIKLALPSLSVRLVSET
jgi:hypothetical protein